MIIAALIWLWLVGAVVTYAHGSEHVFYRYGPSLGDWTFIAGWPLSWPLAVILVLCKK